MRCFIARLGAVAALALLLPAAIAVAGERVPLHKAPTPVIDTVRARFKDARIAAVEKEREGGKLVYQVTLRFAGQTVDVTLTPEGVMLLIETEITARDLPEPVLETLADRYPKATYKTLEQAVEVNGTQEKLAWYAIELVTARGKRLEAIVSPDGTLMREEK